MRAYHCVRLAPGLRVELHQPRPALRRRLMARSADSKLGLQPCVRSTGRADPPTHVRLASSQSILRLDALLGMDDLTTRADELDGVALAWLTIDAERDVRSAHVELGQLDARGRIEAASLERLEERRLGEGARAHPHPAPTRVGVERTVRLVVMGIVCGQPVGPATEPEEVV